MVLIQNLIFSYKLEQKLDKRFRNVMALVIQWATFRKQSVCIFLSIFFGRFLTFLLLADLASGSSIDWAYATRNVSLAYTFEFRDKGSICNFFKLFRCFNFTKIFFLILFQFILYFIKDGMDSYCHQSRLSQIHWK